MATKQTDRRGSTTICVLRPEECSAVELRAFAEKVRAGWQVSTIGLDRRIAQAAWLGFARVNQELAGIAAIKKPEVAYRKKVFALSKSGLLASRFPFEFGWMQIDPKYRGYGIAKSLLDELLARIPEAKIFATTADDNSAMQRVLTRAGFNTVGCTFPSARDGRSLSLWIRSSK